MGCKVNIFKPTQILSQKLIEKLVESDNRIVVVVNSSKVNEKKNEVMIIEENNKAVNDKLNVNKSGISKLKSKKQTDIVSSKSKQVQTFRKEEEETNPTLELINLLVSKLNSQLNSFDDSLKNVYSSILSKFSK